MNPYSIPFLISALLFLSLGIFILLKSKVNKQATLGFFLGALSTFWWQVSYGLLVNSHNEQTALIFAMSSYTGVSFIATAFFHFFVYLTDQKSLKKLVPLYYFIGFLFVLNIWSSRLIVEAVVRFFFGYHTRGGPVHFLFLIYITVVALSCLYCLVKRGIDVKWRGAYGQQIKFLLIAFFIYCGASTDFLVAVGREFYPLGFLFTFFAFLICCYVIVRYEFMDIRLALTNAGIFLIVYGVILGVPFLIGYNFGYKIAFWLMFIMATFGPFVYSNICRKAEEKIFFEERRYQKLILDSASNLIQFRSVGKLVTFLMEFIHKEMQLDHMLMYVADTQEEAFILQKVVSDTEKQYREKVKTVEPFINYLIEQKQAVLTDELTQKYEAGKAQFVPLYIDLLKHWEAHLIVPLVNDNKLMAFIVFGSKPGQSFYTKTDISVLSAFAQQAALAIENCFYINSLISSK